MEDHLNPGLGPRWWFHRFCCFHSCGVDPIRLYKYRSKRVETTNYLRSHPPLKDTKRTFHQQFMFMEFLCLWVKGEVWGSIFPGAHVGKIIETRWATFVGFLLAGHPASGCPTFMEGRFEWPRACSQDGMGGGFGDGFHVGPHVVYHFGSVAIAEWPS